MHKRVGITADRRPSQWSGHCRRSGVEYSHLLPAALACYQAKRRCPVRQAPSRLARFRVPRTPDPEREKKDNYDCIINLLWQKQLRFIEESISYLKEALPVTDEEIAKTFFPNALKEATKSAWVNGMREMISEYGLDPRKVAAAASRPESLTCEEAIELLTRKAP